MKSFLIIESLILEVLITSQLVNGLRIKDSLLKYIIVVRKKGVFKKRLFVLTWGGSYIYKITVSLNK